MKDSDSNNELTVYELGYLILPSIPEDNLSSVTDAIRGVISKEGGVEIDAEEPFLEPLAYSMSKTIGASRYVVTDAYLGWIKFEAESSKVEKIKSAIEKIEQILRFLLVKAPRETTFTLARAKEVKEVIQEEESVTSSPIEELVVQS